MGAGPFTNVGKDIGLYIESLKDVTMNSAKSVDSKLPLLFNMGTTNMLEEYFLSMSGIGPFQSWNGTGDTIVRESIDQRYKTTLTQALWALATSYHYLDKKFLKYGLLNDQAQQLGLQGANTKNRLGTNWFAAQIAGTGTVWNATENKYLFATDHPLVGGAVSTYSNKLSLALSVSSLQSAYTLLKQTPDDQGLLMNLKAKRLFVAANLEFTAYEVYGRYSDYRAGSANLTENAFKETAVDKLDIQVIPEWPNNYWMLQGDRHGCLWETSIDMDQKQYVDDDTEDTIHRAIFGVAYGARDWRGLVASPGS